MSESLSLTWLKKLCFFLCTLDRFPSQIKTDHHRYSWFAITRVIVLESSYLFLTEGMYTSGYITVNVTKRLKNWKKPQGLAVIFSHRQVYVKREGRTLFLLPNVKVEFRHLFSLQKRFSLCSYHNINANIVVFCWLTGLQWNNTRF
jgi:hypothetical protein